MQDEFFRVVSVSGGKDSTALYLWAIEQGFKFRAVFADTGHEHPVTVNYVRNMHTFCNGPEVEIVKADFTERLAKKGLEKSDSVFFDMIRYKGRVPSSKAQFCTELVKLEPIRKWLLKERGEKPSIVYVGIRAAESAKRAKMPEVELNEYQDSLLYRPLLKWTEEQVFSLLKKHNVEPNPLYGLGYSRVGCYPCIHARKSELAILPDWAWEKIESWENSLGRTWFGYGSIPLTDDQKAEILDAERANDIEKIKELKNKFSPKVSEVRAWAQTDRGGKQFTFFEQDEKDPPSCMNSWGHCE